MKKFVVFLLILSGTFMAHGYAADGTLISFPYDPIEPPSGSRSFGQCLAVKDSFDCTDQCKGKHPNCVSLGTNCEETTVDDEFIVICHCKCPGVDPDDLREPEKKDMSKETKSKDDKLFYHDDRVKHFSYEDFSNEKSHRKGKGKGGQLWIE